MTLSQERLSQHLDCPFQYFDSVDSTNDIAKAWLQDGAIAGSAVIGDEQIKGRGRKGRIWHNPPNVAIAMSVILHPPVQYLSRINLIGALSVYDLAVHVGCDEVGIKWPNDVQVDGKKISGILPEVVWERGKLIGVVLGMGINVRVDFINTDLAEKAISLETVVDTSLDRSQLVAYLLKRVDYWTKQIETDTLFSTWKSRLNMLGKFIQVEQTEGIATDVRPDGTLLLKDSDNKIQEILAGDVFVIERDLKA